MKLPVIDELTIIKAMGKKQMPIPGIIITEMSELNDKIDGLDNGKRQSAMTVLFPKNRKSSELFSFTKNKFTALLLVLSNSCDYANTGSLFLMTVSTSSIVFSTHSAICSNV